MMSQAPVTFSAQSQMAPVAGRVAYAAHPQMFATHQVTPTAAPYSAVQHAPVMHARGFALPSQPSMVVQHPAPTTYLHQPPSAAHAMVMPGASMHNGVLTYDAPGGAPKPGKKRPKRKQAKGCC
eukprot:TRINITY_DN57387_c0_g1_i1.p2 TRINITY_DN57387_c0_g1~~TRINITY_DN57387_c0_g1_i1.p2  ORF type:complete len:124 (-),score=14.72 TRINITY_DN57387_c0_g1_i1:87-458(-)